MSIKDIVILSALITLALIFFGRKEQPTVYIPGNTGYWSSVTLTKDQWDHMTLEEAYNAMVPPEDRSGCVDNNANCVDATEFGKARGRFTGE